MLKHQYEVHPAATLFPPMTEDEYQGLKKDIAENGQREDIVVWCDKLIDGRHRLRACEELQRNPHVSELDPDTDPWKYVISHNLHRRHLTTGQRSAVAAKLVTMQRGGDRKSEKIKGQICTSIDDAAEALNVSPRSVKSAKQVQERGSEAVKQAVEKGTLPVSLAAKFVKEVPDKKEQSKIVSKGVEEVRATVATKLEALEYEDVEDEPVKEDFKLAEFKKFWAKCSDVSKAAIRIFVNDN